MSEKASRTPRLRASVEHHYDSLRHLYRAFWGDHIHHGLWQTADDPPEVAQENLVERLAARAGIRSGERVLDVGCGYGASARWLAEHRGCRVIGITISRRQARLARRVDGHRARGAGVAVVRGDAADPPFADDAFEIVWVIECLEHLEDKRAFVAQVARMLAPGGRLALCAWLRADGVPKDEPLVREVCDAFLCPGLASAAELSGYCEDAGLRVGRQEDLTDGVRQTWTILRRRVDRPWLAPLRWLVGAETRRFVAGFSSIDRAYELGRMSYGLLVASRPQGNPLARP